MKIQVFLIVLLVLWGAASRSNLRSQLEYEKSKLLSQTNSQPFHVAYFVQWGIYQRNYKVKNIETTGVASMLTHINYAFGNIYKQADGTFQCGQINKAESGNGDGGDSWADYQKGFSADQSVDGQADDWGFPWDDPRTGQVGPLKGNFNQLKKLKAQHPNLKVLISLGGWTWSKYFSIAASTDLQRKTVVSSCIDQYIKGNLPFDSGSNAGGQGMLAGVFDGIDIDWEYPVFGGLDTNIYSPNDTENFTLLLKQFRSQLDAYGKSIGKYYELTAAVPSGTDKIQNTNVKEYVQQLDRVNIMTYDFRGAWNQNGPTNFHSNIYTSTTDPSDNQIERTYAIDSAVDYYIREGVNPGKIVIGMPFYGRGWTGVSPGPNGDGLYQPATGGAHGTFEEGVDDYKVLKNINGQRRIHPETLALWVYDGNNFWSYDDEYVIQSKVKYLREQKLGGAMVWSLDGDDASATLSNAIFTSLQAKMEVEEEQFVK